MPRIRVRCRFNAGAVDHTFVLTKLEDFGVGGGNTMNYLQVVRGPQYAAQGGENSGIAHLYWGNLSMCIRNLTMEINQHFDENVETQDAGPDAVVRAPSSCNLNCPYYGHIKRTFSNAVDLSSHISKGAVSSGAPGSSFNDVLNDYHFADAGGFPQLGEAVTNIVRSMACKPLPPRARLPFSPRHRQCIVFPADWQLLRRKQMGGS